MSEKTDDTSRRTVMGLVGLGLGAPLLAACGADEEPPTGSGGGDGSSPTADGSPAQSPAAGLAAKSEIPVGGGKIFRAEKVVLTQPSEGAFKAFSAVCTHQGCVVSSLEGEEINCACHGSRFSIEDGSVLDGPANGPLEELSVTAEGDNLSVG